MPTVYPDRTVACLATALTFVLAAGAARAQTTDADLAANSSIELDERAQGGSYQRYVITVSSRDGVASLVADKDGTRVERELPQNEYLALWREVLQAEMLALDAPPRGGSAPDGSLFIVRHRLGAETGGFRVYDVDSRPDRRYRDVVRAILALGDRHLRAR